MRHIASVLSAVAGFGFVGLGLSGCSEQGAPDDADIADTMAQDYAARIKGEAGGQTASSQPGVVSNPGVDPAQPPAPANAPSVAVAPPSAATGPYAPGTATDPNTACNAGLFAAFLGQAPSAQVRAQIAERAVDLPEVRYIPAGSEFIKPDPTNPRLNIMIAVDGIIRDIRCG